jgi:hypothetical protein
VVENMGVFSTWYVAESLVVGVRAKH